MSTVKTFVKAIDEAYQELLIDMQPYEYREQIMDQRRLKSKPLAEKQLNDHNTKEKTSHVQSMGFPCSSMQLTGPKKRGSRRLELTSKPIGKSS